MGTIPLLYGPLQVYLNLAAASAEPDPSADLATPWFRLGTNANLGYSSDGVRLEVAESLTDIFTDGTTMAVDTRRTEESILLTATLTENTLNLDLLGGTNAPGSPVNMFQMAFNNNDVTEVSASPSVEGSSTIELYQGPHVSKFQFLARAMSDPDDDEDGPFPVQFWIPTVRLAGSISSAFVKGDPLMVEASFMALYHPTLGAGTLKQITAATT